MYKIMIRASSAANYWLPYMIETPGENPGDPNIKTEYSTDSLDELKATTVTLLDTYSKNQLKLIQDLSYILDVVITPIV